MKKKCSQEQDRDNVIQRAYVTCLDFLVLLIIKCAGITVNLKYKKAKSHYVGKEGKKGVKGRGSEIRTSLVSRDGI